MANEQSETIRCPMCGKPNPAEEEVCRHCGARLKPLTADAKARPTADSYPQAGEEIFDLSAAAQDPLSSLDALLSDVPEDEDLLLGEIDVPLPEEESAPAETDAPLPEEEAAPAADALLPEALGEAEQTEPLPPAEAAPWSEGTPEEEALAEAFAETDAEAPATEEAAPEAEESLAPAELPSWLEAMRPVESPPEPPEEEEPPVETQGPLTGLRGVLPPLTAAMLHAEERPWVSGRLALSPEHKKKIDILEQLVRDEFTPQALSRPRTPGTQRILRWLVAAVVLLAAFLPLVAPAFRQAALPGPFPAARAAQTVVARLPQQAAVLLAIDYSPAFSGEMAAAARPLLADLQAKKAHLVVVSTHPLGPALADNLLTSLPRPYTAATTLGYVPGGAAGLYTFARLPRLLFATNAAGHSLWADAALDRIHTAADFDLVVVCTDDPEVARMWVEQVQPLLGQGTPLLMVVSAQAEPLVEPYYETAPRQVAGVITGLEGGMAYAATREMKVSSYTWLVWNGYAWVVLAAVALMAAAGLYNLLLGWWEARRHPRQSLLLDDTADEA